jgi:predicted small lipoprotein YifL
MKTKLISVMLAVLLLFGFAGCGGDGDSNSSGLPPTNVSPNVDVSSGDTETNETYERKYYYENLDVSKFDISKFDRIVKMDNRTNFTLQTPVTIDSIVNSGHIIKTAADENIFEDERINYPPGEEVGTKIVIITLYISASNNNEDTAELEIDFVKNDVSIKELFEGNYFYFSNLGTAGLHISNIINANSSDSTDDKNKEAEKLIHTLGQPSKILYQIMESEEYPGAFYELCYEYEDCTLVFSFMENEYANSLTGYHYFPKEAWTIWFDKNTANNDKSVIE